MSDELIARFRTEFEPASFAFPRIHLSYTDRQRLKEGDYAEVARAKLPDLARAIRWSKLAAGIGAVLLLGGAVLTGLAHLGIGAAHAPLEAVAFPLFIAFCFGVAAVVHLWRMPNLEKKRVLCEVVAAQYGSSPQGAESQRAPAV